MHRTCIWWHKQNIVNLMQVEWLGSGEMQDSGDFWAQPAKIRPFTTSTGFPRNCLVANLLPFIWTSQYPIFFSSAGWLLLHYNDNRPRTWALISKPVFQCSKIMKCNNEAKASPVCHSLYRYKAYNGQITYTPRTKWYLALDESHRMRSAHFTIHLGKNPPPQNGCQLKSVFFF
jgi:hypothetical protein